MLDHIVLEVSDLKTAKDFYLAALKPLNYEIFMEFDYVIGLAVNGKPDFWAEKGVKTSPHAHIAFRADNRDLVDQFYTAALAAGGKDNGAPGIREQYHPDYYGAFILDPDGHNIEAVCHAPVAENGQSPQILIVNHRKLKSGKTYDDFHQAWLPPVANPHDKASLSGYFRGPVKIFNAVDVNDPAQIITVAVISGDLDDIKKESERLAVTEKVRSEKVRQVADKTLETRMYKVIGIDDLGV